jgi:hypothetical protein
MIKFTQPIFDSFGEIVWEQEIFPSPDAAKILIRVCVHEAGHAEVALNFGADVQGVAVTNEKTGLTAMTLYQLRLGSTLEQRCVIYAAGSAAEMMEYGDYTDGGATDDKEDIRKAGCDQDYDLLLRKAERVLIARRTNFQRVASPQ